MTTLVGVSLARENMPKLNVDIFCNEIDAKSYYADGSVENVKLDGEGLQVEVRPDHLSTKFKTLSIKTKYKYVSGFLEEMGGKQNFNLSFTQEYGGTWGTKTVTLMFDGEMGRLC